MTVSPTTRQRIVNHLKNHGSSSSVQLATVCGISRKAVIKHLRKLLDERQIYKTGSTRAARYHLSDAPLAAQSISRNIALKNTDESTVYEQFAVALNFHTLKPNVAAIIHYAFTEMLNNVIDHALVDQCHITMSTDAHQVKFTIRDRGVGVFASIADKFELPDEHVAMVELIKGKTTTMPSAHTGEGLFFTARAADRFELTSHRTRLEWSRRLNDVFVSAQRNRDGTEVQFEIANDARTRLEDVFNEYAPEEYDFQFERTKVHVKLLKPSYVSRSEARRLMHNLHRFREVELNMRAVDRVGQGFADEVFRVFQQRHPNTVVCAAEVSDPVAAMIRHAGGVLCETV